MLTFRLPSNLVHLSTIVLKNAPQKDSKLAQLLEESAPINSAHASFRNKKVNVCSYELIGAWTLKDKN